MNVTLGSSFLATQGWRMESLWDSLFRRVPEPISPATAAQPPMRVKVSSEIGLAAPNSAKRMECARLPGAVEGHGTCESGSKLPHSKRFATYGVSIRLRAGFYLNYGFRIGIYFLRAR